MSLHELLSDIGETKDTARKSVSLTEFITRVIKYISKNKSVMSAVGVSNKSAISKCKLLMKSVITRGNYKNSPCYHASITEITLIGANSNSNIRLNVKSVQDFILTEYGRTDTKYRLTPKQSERYEKNRSDDSSLDYNVFVHTCKKKSFRRRDYYDLTITPENVRIPKLR